jgi:hypothetical protein
LKFFYLALCAGALAAAPLPKDDGYRGIWYYNQPSGDKYVYKYSGGFATYPQQQLPIAYYSAKANKTFFCYGGRPKEENRLLHMVSYYDHATGRVPRPAILVDKKTSDAHDNPVLMLDDDGYVWIFSNAHGTSRPAFIFRGKRPYSVDEFERISTTNFSYGQPWFLPGKGFFFLHTRYRDKGRSLFWMTSPDGKTWDEPHLLSRLDLGHYQVSWRDGTRIGTMFNYHPNPVGLNQRTNLYYLETRDQGRTWTNAAGQAMPVPLAAVNNPALVHDYKADGLLVYIKDLNFDAQGRPVLLFLTSKGYESGPANDPRTWHTARWDGKQWQIRRVTTSDHNYDFGSLYIEAGGVWRVIAPTDAGPQPYFTGGDMVMWTSRDQGLNWTRVRQLTKDGRYNHTYARRPVNAHPGFYALWADGDAGKESDSRLYFTDREGSHVWMLPASMSADSEKPQIVR